MVSTQISKKRCEGNILDWSVARSIGIGISKWPLVTKLSFSSVNQRMMNREYTVSVKSSVLVSLSRFIGFRLQ